MNDDELLEKYVDAFPSLSEMLAHETLFPIAWQLAVGDDDQYGYKRWRPIKLETAPSMLEGIYAKLPARLPKLFERMVLSYRWAEVDLGTYRLLSNPPGPDLSGLLRQMSKASAFWEALLPAGFIQFGMGRDMDFDPVCFDIRTRKQGGDCRIAKIDHEEILCNNRVKVVAELAPSFHTLILQTIELASKVPPLRPV
jgi:hypothetical protein